MRKLFLRFGGFAALPLLSAVAPLLLLPIIARVGGVDGWASVATAQAVGAFGAVGVSFGWNIAGPPRIARAVGDAAHRRIYAESFTSRVIAFAVLSGPLMALSAVLASPSHRLDAVMMTCAMTFLGLSPAWYAIGLGRPSVIATYEALPKFVATAAAAGLLLLGSPIWVYPALLIIVSLVGLMAFHKIIVASWWPWFGGRDGSVWRPTRAMLVAAAVDVTGSTYGATPLPIVSATNSILATGMFASADKLFRYGMFGISALANALQAWVLDGASSFPRRRHLAAICAHLVLGGLGLGFLAVAGPWATGLLFGAPVAAAGDVCLWFGVAYFFLSATTPLMRNLLLPHGRAPVILRATLISAGVGVPVMILGGLWVGGVGVAVGLATSEAIIMAAILPEAIQQLRRIGRE